MKAAYDKDQGGYIIESDDGLKEYVRLSGPEAVKIVTDLYSLGLEFDMPSNDSYLTGKLEATEKHLEDLRRLVMDGIAPEKK